MTKRLLKAALRPINKIIPINHFYYLSVVMRKSWGTYVCECPICSYKGHFRAYGHPPRYNARCPRCGSLERHRLFRLSVERNHIFSGKEETLHFAGERCLSAYLRASSKTYQTADIESGRDDLVLNIEKIDLPDNSYDVIIANEVLEHVNDAVALSEIRRILRPGGRALITVPIVYNWDTTYENPDIQSPALRELHFGQKDHVRYFGRDFRNRVAAAGFTVFEDICDPATALQYSIRRGESVFICTAPQPVN